MPVQVNEVIVRTTVETKATCDPAEAPKEGSADSELIERVLEILRESKER